MIAVISMLVAILVPSLYRARESARRMVCVANLKHVGVGVVTYGADFNEHAPPIMTPMGTTAPRTLLSRSGEYVNLGHLIGDSIDDLSIFHCPSQTRFGFNNRLGMVPAATVAGSYAYAIDLPSNTSPRLGAMRYLALASDDFVSRIGETVGMGRYAHRTGYNVLHTDGSAIWYSDPDETVWKQGVHWDDETDDVSYQVLYDPTVEIDEDQYGNALDIFRVWHSFCYDRQDPF